MARIRTVKPEFFTHPEVLRCSIPARLLLISLWGQADDEGRLWDQPRRIGGLAFGDADKVNVEKLLAELHTENRILRYSLEDGRRVIQCLNFSLHQSIPPTKFRSSTLPPSEDGLPDSSDSPTAPQEDGSETAAPEQTDRSPEWNGTGMEQGMDTPTASDTPAPLPDVNGRDPIWAAVADACDIDRSKLTDSGRRSIGKQAAALREVKATPEEIAELADLIRRLRKRTPHPAMLVSMYPQLAALREEYEAYEGRVRQAQDIQRKARR